MNSQMFNFPFLKKEQVSEDTWSYFFDRSGTTYDFQAGQYNRVTLPIEATDGRGNSRFFTVASSPTDSDMIMITTKRGISDFKNALFALTPGTPVQFFGPMGGFTISPEDQTPRVLIAGGIGITPFHSIIVNSAVKNLATPLTLLVSFSTTEEMVFYEELTDLAKDHTNVQIIYTITHPEKSKKSWQGETGRVTPELIRKYVSNTAGSIFMVSGPAAFVDAMVDTLHKEVSATEDKVKVDQFTGY